MYVNSKLEKQEKPICIASFTICFRIAAALRSLGLRIVDDYFMPTIQVVNENYIECADCSVISLDFNGHHCNVSMKVSTMTVMV